jgi:hypothetical protein
MDKATLLDMLRANRALFESTLARVREPYLTGPCGADQRSAKDIVAHLTAWEGRLIGWLAAAQGQTPQIPEPGATWDDMDRLNARDFPANLGRALDEVLADSRRSFQQLLDQVAAFCEEELTEPGRYDWMKGAPLWRRIAAGPGYGHYQAHLYDLLQRIDRSSWFVPDSNRLAAYAGTYVADDESTLTIRVADATLFARMPWDERDRPCLALDEARFAYEEGGMITFRVDEHGAARSLECWSYIFDRVAPG